MPGDLRTLFDGHCQTASERAHMNDDNELEISPDAETAGQPAPARRNPPFEKLVFTLAQNRVGRKMFRMKLTPQGYELHVERGSASNPSSQFTRMVPQETAQKLKDALDALGVFSWDEQYGDAAAPGAMRWSLNTVFKEGVFSVASKGGSTTPANFDALLEELYRLDFPRPEGAAKAPATTPIQPSSAASRMISDAMKQTGVDFSSLPAGMGDALSAMLGDLKSADALDALSAMRRNPQEIQQRMKDEFAHMSPDEQNQLLDALAQTGMASRAWWERFFRGL